MGKRIPPYMHILVKARSGACMKKYGSSRQREREREKKERSEERERETRERERQR